MSEPLLDPKASHNVVLDAGTDLVTLINTYEVAPERAEELVAFLVHAAESVFLGLDGFVSASFHVSLDGVRVVNYSQWRSLEATAAAREDPRIADLMREQMTIAESFLPVPYKLRRTLVARRP